jgi:tetratricopeptide (TPR) repeat protein
MTTVATGLASAREAVSRYAWREAFDLFAAADAADPLGPDDLNRMAECAWWLGKMRHCIALRERAHAAYLKADDPRHAALVAIDLVQHHADLGEIATAEGWLQTATRLLEGQPEGAEHGWLLLGVGFMKRGEGDLLAAGDHAAEASEIGARHGDKDLFALGHSIKGVALTYADQPELGLPMVEEATQGAVNGELGPRATGMIYCMMIAVNAQVADWERAGQWTEAAKRWCNRQAINGFPGVCRVHRAEIMRLRGAFSEAEEEARTATIELGSFNLAFTALAFRELGEVRLKMGDIDAAEDAFRQASEMGAIPQPGLARAMVQRGRPDAAATALRRALADPALLPLDRAKLLPAQLDVAVLLDDVETARSAAAELDAIATSHASPALRAMADAGIAAVRLADGAYEEAEQAARSALSLFEEVDLVYEAARVSMLLGRVYKAAGDAAHAKAELDAALSEFERIGAVPDARAARELLVGAVG